MKILIVVPALSEIYGGPTRIARSLAAALVGQGCNVDLITTNAHGRANLNEPPRRWLEQDAGYRVLYAPRIGSSEFKPSWRLTSWLWHIVRDYDVVHLISDFNYPVLAAASICRMRGVPYVVNPQGMLEPWALRNQRRKKLLYYFLIEKPLVLHGASVIQALNDNEAQNIKTLSLRPVIAVIPNGVDVDDTCETGEFLRNTFYERFPDLRGKSLILFMHRIDPKKGLDLLACAFALVARDFPNARVVVAGPDNVGYAATAMKMFEKEGCGNIVIFTGMLEGTIKKAALASAEIFVAPSYSEGFSISILEAMAAGLPCVITTGCNFPEAGALGFAKEVAIDYEALASAMAELLTDKDKARRMGGRAREFVLKNYLWSHVAQKMSAVYSAILKP